MIGTLPLMALLNAWGGQVAAADSLCVLAKPEIMVPSILVLLLIAGGGFMGRRLLSRASVPRDESILRGGRYDGQN